MKKEVKEAISSFFEPFVNQDGIEQILPDERSDDVLSAVLNRKIVSTKRPRDYSLASFSGLYAGALPFMKAGLATFSRGEVLFLNEVIQSVTNRGGRPDRLVLASQDGATLDYPFSWMVESDIMAALYLKTTGGDTYEGLLHEFIEWVTANASLSETDATLLKSALQEFDSVFSGKQINVLNPLPGYHSKRAYKSRGPESAPESVAEIFTQPVEILDQRPLSLDLMTPHLKDLIDRARNKNLKADSVGLSSLSPLMEILDRNGVLGIVIQVENGAIKKLSLAKKVAAEAEMPLFGPVRAMTSLLFSMANQSAQFLESYNVDWLVSYLIETKGFFAITTKGAVAAPSNPQQAYLGGSRAVRAKDNKVSPAVETFIFQPQNNDVGSLDPVAVAYETMQDRFDCFKVTRQSFYALDTSAVTPIHQGVICIGVDRDLYTSACLDNEGSVAKQILSESYSFLTGYRGIDQIADNTEEARDLLLKKYSLTKAFRGGAVDADEESLIDLISGRLGQNGGLSSEVYSLFYQSSAEDNPTYFAASIHAAKFLCDVRTYAERFDLKSYLTEET